jgi:hypothetical protein
MRKTENAIIKSYDLFIDSDHNNDFTLNLELRIGKSEGCCFSIDLTELSIVEPEPLKFLFSVLGVTHLDDLINHPIVAVSEEDTNQVIGVGNFLADLSFFIKNGEDYFITKDFFTTIKN